MSCDKYSFRTKISGKYLVIVIRLQAAPYDCTSIVYIWLQCNVLANL